MAPASDLIDVEMWQALDAELEAAEAERERGEKLMAAGVVFAGIALVLLTLLAFDHVQFLK